VGQIVELRNAIDSASTVFITSHVHPDGDAVGSLLALHIALAARGKSVSSALHDAIPRNLRFLPRWNEIAEIHDEHAILPAADLAILVDVGHLPRVGRTQKGLLAAKSFAVIDHHQLGEDNPGDIRVIDPDASATSLILYQIFHDIGLEMTPEIAQCLLTGIATDTGSFRFRNTDPESLDAASHLVAIGADLSIINEEVWEKKPLAAVSMLGRALQHLQLLCDGRIATSYLTNLDYAECGALDEHTEGIVNEVGRVDTVLITALFREPTKNRVRVSVRSRGDIDVSAVCRKFGGGGHINAAGCTFEGSIENAMSILVAALKECLGSC
jgi:phosphoesterase RecJ-like protein